MAGKGRKGGPGGGLARGGHRERVFGPSFGWWDAGAGESRDLSE